MTRVPALAALGGYLVAIVVVTVVLSPLALTAMHRLGATGATLEDVTLRLLEIVAIVLTLPLLAVLGGSDARAWAIPRPARRWLRVWRGVVIGVATLAPVCAVLFALDVRVTRVDLTADTGYWAQVALGAAGSAAVIALSEELWFRGGLFTALVRVAGPALALWGGAALYAATHFLAVPDGFPAGIGSSLDGLHVLASALGAVARVENLDSFAALLFAGVALGIARLRDADIALCIGIHAGWVFTIKIFKKLTYVSDETPLRVLAGSYDDVIGWLTVPVLALLALALWRSPQRSEAAR